MSKKFTSTLKNVGNGILTGASILADAPTMKRIREIDDEIEQLQKERARLAETLINKNLA